jgi:polyhydroxybutyrate depolymerase
MTAPLLLLAALAPITATPSQRQLPVESIEVDGVSREYVVVRRGDQKKPGPLLFGFHGHGGSMKNAARSFRFHELWDDATVVYMQGLNTPGMTDPEGKKPGWQKFKGDQSDRDLKFFDAVLAKLKAEQIVDAKRIFCSGHSNGGGFTYFLWATHPGLFAGIGPSAAGFGGLQGIDRDSLKPTPLMPVIGTEDTVVRPEGQERTIAQMRTMNGCEPTNNQPLGLSVSKSLKGYPVVVYRYKGGHKLPEDAPEKIIDFFKRISASL